MAVATVRSTLEAPPSGNERAQQAYLMAQLADLAYHPVEEAPLASGSTPLGLTSLSGDGCNEFEVVRCETRQHVSPVSGANLSTPTFCLLRSSDVLVLTMRGTASADDAAVDAYGCSWLEDAPALGGVASVHGGFWRAWSHSGAATVVVEWLRAEDASSSGDMLPLWVTGHSLGGGLAAIAAHDLSLAMLNGSVPLRPIELVTFGKPVIGSHAWVASFETLLSDGSSDGKPLRYAARYAAATEWGVDPIASVSENVDGLEVILVHAASASEALDEWVWLHEIAGFEVPCCFTGEDCDVDHVLNRTNVLLCHMMSVYQPQVRT